MNRSGPATRSMSRASCRAAVSSYLVRPVGAGVLIKTLLRFRSLRRGSAERDAESAVVFAQFLERQEPRIPFGLARTARDPLGRCSRAWQRQAGSGRRRRAEIRRCRRRAVGQIWCHRRQDGPLAGPRAWRRRSTHGPHQPVLRPASGRRGHRPRRPRTTRA